MSRRGEMDGRRGLRRVGLIASSLSLYFDGDATHLADATRLQIRQADSSGLVAIFAPALDEYGLPLVMLARGLADHRRDYFVALGVGHHYLGHAALEFYRYRLEGPAYESAREFEEADAFAKAFLNPEAVARCSACGAHPAPGDGQHPATSSPSSLLG